MPRIALSAQEKAHLVARLQKYFAENLAADLDRFDAELLIAFIAEDLGAVFYNRGLADAQDVVHERLLLVQDAIAELAEPTELGR